MGLLVARQANGAVAFYAANSVGDDIEVIIATDARAIAYTLYSSRRIRQPPPPLTSRTARGVVARSMMYSFGRAPGHARSTLQMLEGSRQLDNIR